MVTIYGVDLQRNRRPTTDFLAIVDSGDHLWDT